MALKHLVAMQSGTARPELSTEGQVPILGAGGIMGFTSYPNVHPPGLTLGRVGTVGTVHKIEQASWASDNVIIAKPCPLIDIQYAYFALLSLNLPSLASTTAQPLLTASNVGRQKIRLPNLEEQRRIANFLNDQVARIDAALVLRRRQQELLRNRFDSALSDAFESPRMRPLKHAAWWIEGPGILAYDFREAGRPVIRLAGVQANTVTLDGCNYVDEEDAARRWGHLAARAGELLISGSGGVRFPVTVPTNIAGAIPYTGLIRIGPRGETTRAFLRYFLGSPTFYRQIDKLKTGVGIQHWGPSHLAQLSIPAMPVQVQNAVAASLQEIEQHQTTMQALAGNQALLLKERKQALITAAVTGQFDVTAARSVA